MPKIKKHPHYWKVKSAFLEQQQIALNARAAVANAAAKVKQVMTEAGLDPAKQYDLNDDTETIVASAQQR